MTGRHDDAVTGLPLAPGAGRLALIPLAIALPIALFSLPGAGAVALLGGVGVLLFHRDPARSVPPGDGLLAPADGRISVVRETDDGRLRVGTFMSPFDVHVNRAPTTMALQTVDHEPGAHRPAFSKDSARNERVLLVGERVSLVLIAGAFARRIHPYVRAGQAVDRGQRVGHISFGSRVDVICPPEIDRADLAVAEGDRVTAGRTVIAEADATTDDAGLA